MLVMAWNAAVDGASCSSSILVSCPAALDDRTKWYEFKVSDPASARSIDYDSFETNAFSQPPPGSDRAGSKN
jgi:hypothetical protein